MEDLPGSTRHVVSVHLLLRREQAESLAAVECRHPDVIREVVLGVHHLYTRAMLTRRSFRVSAKGNKIIRGA